MTVFLIVSALLAAGLIAELVAASHAPFGYQDKNGFHLGFNSRESQPMELENPS